MQLKLNIGIFARLAGVALCFLAVSSASRIFLVIYYWDRVSLTDGTAFILLQGLRFDLMLVGMLLGPAFLARPWFHTRATPQSPGSFLISIYAGLITFMAFFVEASSLPFIAEFDSRPNYLFVEYLRYPREVFATLAGSYLIELISITITAVLLAWLVYKWLRNDPRGGEKISLQSRLLLTTVIAVLVFLMVRSTLDHRPVNPSVAAFSQDAMVNQLPLNSPYSLMYAIYEHNRDKANTQVRYGAMDDHEALAIVLEEAGITPDQQLDPAVPTLHHQEATRETDKPLNLVIILEESLGAGFVQSLEGKNLMPELDKLASQGILLERLYSTGTRSARGIEAVISGFTPTPRRSVVKLAETQSNFFTLASLLEEKGYKTGFIYGGEAHFDNMKRFFLNNGFQSVIDEKDYEKPEYLGSWGVSDEDLFDRAHEEFTKAGEQPFFSLVFTSSNHKPFDIPGGRVDHEQGPDGPRETAVRYADYALGRFFDMARQSGYWEDTVFLIIADHAVRIRGGKLVPVEKFRIPGVIVGATIKPARIPGISSQIDMVPTLLSLIGISSDHPAIGRDLTRPEFASGAGRAMMQFNTLQAYLENDRVVVLQPDREPGFFRLDSTGAMVADAEGDPELERKALAHATFGVVMIKTKAYRLGSRNE